MITSQPSHAVLDAHIPDDFTYGPVESRRFGLSLGVSFSQPGVTKCKWRCPYRQLRDWTFNDDAPWPVWHDIVDSLAVELQQSEESPQVITVAGGGEPTDHPQFAELSYACREQADIYGAELRLLTNGDGWMIRTIGALWQPIISIR